MTASFLSKGGSVTNVAGRNDHGRQQRRLCRVGIVGSDHEQRQDHRRLERAAPASISAAAAASPIIRAARSRAAGLACSSTGALGTVTNSGSISGAHGVGLRGRRQPDQQRFRHRSRARPPASPRKERPRRSSTPGSITATSGAGADIEGGGSITNQAGATLSGSSFGVFITGGASTVTNAGTISGGSYAIDFAGSATNRLIVDPGAVFIGKRHRQ